MYRVSTLLVVSLLLVVPALALDGFSSPRDGFSASSSVVVQDTAVFSTGYVSEDGTSWDSFSLSGEQRGSWVVGGATSNVDLSNIRYVAAYSCTWSGGWDCSETWQVLDREQTSQVPQIMDSRAGDEESLRLHAEALNVDNWDYNRGWSATSMSLEDEIFGVTVETIDGELRVTEIDLISNNLVGQLPEWPGLQEMWKYYVKQPVPELGGNQPERITGAIPKSLGAVSKKVTHLSLAGRRMISGNEHLVLRPDEERLNYNMKSGVAANQYTGGFPEELKQLRLRVLEIDGQWSQFGGVWDPEWGTAWDIERFFMYGNGHHKGQSDLYPDDDGFSLSGTISNTKHWVNCQWFVFGNQKLDGIALDAFEGWNDISDRRIYINQEPDDPTVWNQELPNMEHLESSRVLVFTGRHFVGPYPEYFHDWTSLSELIWDNVEFTFPSELTTFPSLANLPKLRRFSFQGKGPSRSPSSWHQSTLPKFGEDEYVGGYFENRMINFNTRYTMLTGGVPDGMHEWYRLRYWYDNHGNSDGTLSLRPPGEYSPSLRRMFLQDNKYTGNIQPWGKLGSLVEYGRVWESGADITGGVQDAQAETYYMEDPTADFNREREVSAGVMVRGYAPETPTDSGRQIRITTDGTTYMTRIVDSTPTRIIYERRRGEIPINGGSTYEVTQNREDDNRAFHNGLSLRSNLLYGPIPEGVALEHAVGGSLSVYDNLLTFKDIRPSLAHIESVAAASGDLWEGNDGWTYLYYSPNPSAFPHQKPFGDRIPHLTPVNDKEIPLGGVLEIDFSDYVNDPYNSYQWYKDDNPLAGQTQNTLTKSNLQESDYGAYYLEVTNPEVPLIDKLVSKTISVSQPAN